ncbi:HupE/UreJ family protein [Pseudazoarcus pumilus]|uniref:Urease accessory protein n=1 Tax=Pseudazoarcus pumilus TaxID=2067960 RepID=A0A2I6S2L9_9RHOO|nr:HupE/UreJ family protein [Pseudazoarcus pumilus]AUN93521.1 urease accessory protein [Pseudazoarcus pumilus]
MKRLLCSLPLALFAGAALAHPGHESVSFFSGFGHPIGGLDHVLAMLAVGLLAARQAGRARWALPVAFVAAMLAGAGLGALGVALPAVESGIALSVLVLGLLIAFVVALPLAVAVPMVAVFALFHGHAHFTEMGHGSMWLYAAGFAIATALLHGAGYALARVLPEGAAAVRIKRVAGGLIAVAGAVFLAA